MNDQQTKMIAQLDKSNPGWYIDLADSRDLADFAKAVVRGRNVEATVEQETARLKLRTLNRAAFIFVNAALECGEVSMPPEPVVAEAKPEAVMTHWVSMEDVNGVERQFTYEEEPDDAKLDALALSLGHQRNARFPNFQVGAISADGAWQEAHSAGGGVNSGWRVGQMG